MRRLASRFMTPALLLATAFAAGPVGADVLLHDNFSYANGNLVPNGGWSAHSGGGTKAIQVISGEARVEQSGGSGEDINRLFPAQSTSATTYASFKLRVPSLGPGGGATTWGVGDEYFAHFRTAANFNFRARLYASAPTGGGNFSLKISATSSGTSVPVAWPTDLSYDTVYNVVTAYNAATGTASLWVNPASQASPSVSSVHATAIGEPVDSYALRQASLGSSHQVVDDLIVSQSFVTSVPAAGAIASWVLAFAMLALGAVFVVRARTSPVA